MKFFFRIFIVLILFLSCNKKENHRTNKQNMYEIALEPKDKNLEYELIEYGKIRNESAPIGDMLSRLWGHFGKPQSILFEGYIYSLKDKTTGLNFIMSFGASGPVYLAEKKMLINYAQL